MLNGKVPDISEERISPVIRVEKCKVTVGGKAVFVACLTENMEEILFFERFVTIYRSQRVNTPILEPARKPVFEGDLYLIKGQEGTIHRP
jgi:hypothetical protein